MSVAHHNIWRAYPRSQYYRRSYALVKDGGQGSSGSRSLTRLRRSVENLRRSCAIVRKAFWLATREREVPDMFDFAERNTVSLLEPI